MAETQNTGQFAKTIVTDVGKDMIAKSQNGQTLTFSRVALGDGLVGEEEDVTKFTAVKNERLSLPIAKYSNLGNGQFQIQFRLTNSQVESGFWHREIGIMAKIDNGQEQLYAYTTAGNKASFIYDKTTPVEERIVNVNFVIGNAQNLEVIINSSVIYATIEDLEEALDAHDAGADAHEPAFDAHNAADDAHKDFTGATAKAAGKRGMVPAPAAGDQNKALFGDKSYKSVVQSINGITPNSDGGITLVTGINMLARNQAYQYGDIAYSNKLPSWAYLFCVTAGTTAASEPSFASVNTMGQYITDGTVKWIVDDVRFGLPVGVVFYDKKLRPGCVKTNGATVQRSDYIRIFHDADVDDAFYDKDDTYTFTGTTTVSGTTITGISAEDIEKLQTAKEVCGDGILITGTGIPEDCMIDEISTDSVTITVAATAAGTVKISYGNIHNYPYLYGWGDGETTFVLPNYRGRVIQGGDLTAVVAPGVPNITGKAWSFCGTAGNGLDAAEGAFFLSHQSTSDVASGQTGSASAYDAININAAACNSIFGKSNTVQAPAFDLITQIKF